jgi:hypothetical protein
MVVVADFSPAHTAEKFLCPIRASAVEAVCLLVIDPLHFETAVEVVPGAGLVGMNDGSLGDPRLDE